MQSRVLVLLLLAIFVGVCFVTTSPNAPSQALAQTYEEEEAEESSSELTLPDGAYPHCGVCHVRYHHQEVSLPQEGTPFPACKQYQKASCCTRETVEILHTDEMYGQEYAINHCGPLSEMCFKYFEAEACLYECSVHAGKYRKFTNCSDLATGEGNVWELYQMPIKASSCDAWFEACKDDYFCVGPSRTFFDRAHCADNQSSNCLPFNYIYRDAKEFCEVMWNNAFKYEEDEEKGYPILLDEEVDIESLEDAGLFHTYDAINIQVEFPEQCDFITGDEDECSNIDEQFNTNKSCK